MSAHSTASRAAAARVHCVHGFLGSQSTTCVSKSVPGLTCHYHLMKDCNTNFDIAYPQRTWGGVVLDLILQLVPVPHAVAVADQLPDIRPGAEELNLRRPSSGQVQAKFRVGLIVH